jgi:hypothetical protein
MVPGCDRAGFVDEEHSICVAVEGHTEHAWLSTLKFGANRRLQGA